MFPEPLSWLPRPPLVPGFPPTLLVTPKLNTQQTPASVGEGPGAGQAAFVTFQPLTPVTQGTFSTRHSPTPAQGERTQHGPDPRPTALQRHPTGGPVHRGPWAGRSRQAKG